jgi:arsenite methyltransferase
MTPADRIEFDARESARKYYGEELTCTDDLKTSACCTIDALPDCVREVLPSVHAEILLKYYGCGTAFPPDIHGLVVLDLGCGTGRDSYVMSRIVGEQGFVHGIDMTVEQIEVAQKYRQHQAEVFGYESPNVAFVHDTIENIDRHFAAESMDRVTSNCVFNLLEDMGVDIVLGAAILDRHPPHYWTGVYTCSGRAASSTSPMSMPTDD